MKSALRSALAVCLMSVAVGHAADTLFWSENGPAPRFQTSPGFIMSGSLPGGTVSSIVSGNSNVKGPNSVEFLGGRVWWTDQQLGDIRSVTPDGSDLQVYGDGTLNPYDLDLVGNTIYWTDQNGNNIFTIDMGNQPWVSHLLMGGLSHPVAIDVVGSYIYWSEVAGTNRIRRADLDGGNAVTLLSNIESRDFEVTDNHIYFSTAFGEVIRTGLDGSGATTLISGLGLLTGIDVTADAIYVARLNGEFVGEGFTTTGGGEIHRMNLDGTGDTVVYTAVEGFQPNFDFRADPIRGVAVLVAAPVPEPSTLLLSGLGLVAVAVFARSRR